MKVTGRDKMMVSTNLVRASDALHAAFQIAAFAHDLDTAKWCRDQTKLIGDKVRELSGPAPISLQEALTP